MLYFEMLVSNNNLLNILLPNDNKVLKEALKEADSKTLEQLAKNSTGSVGDVLKDLFENLKTGTKSNTNIESILKNSTVFKEMGNFPDSLSTILENLTSEEKNPTLEKFKPQLENFLKNIKDMDANTLKTQLQNSGVFLESKMTQTPNAKIENILNQIQNLIKDLNTPQAKQVNELISKLIQSPNSNDFTSNLKTLTNSLEKLNNSIQTPQTQNISTSLNQLKNILNEASLTESKISNNVVVNTNTKENINLQTKELLTQLKNEIVQNPVLQTNKSIMPILENLLKMGNLFDKNEILINQPASSNVSTFTSNFSSNITPLLTNLKDTLENLNPNNLSLQNQVTKIIEKIEDIIKELSNPATHKNQTQNLDEDMKSILLKMQDELSSKTDAKSQELSKQVDKLLTQIDYQQLLSLSSNSNSVYLPFLWDMIEDGNISMKKADENKFYCQINLTLKDFGKVDLMLALYDKNKLDLTVYAQREHFKTAIRDNMQQLKIALNSVDLIPVNIKLLDLKDENESKNKPTQTYINNSYNQNINLTSGIDIRA
jgi:soluble cytochrome b562